MNERTKEKLAALIAVGSEEPMPMIWAHAPTLALGAGHTLSSWLFMRPSPKPLSLALNELNDFHQSLKSLVESDEDLGAIFEVINNTIQFREVSGLYPEHEEIKDLKKYWRPKFNLPRLDLRSGKRPTEQEKSLWLANISQGNK
jgi:hypothetical protein